MALRLDHFFEYVSLSSAGGIVASWLSFATDYYEPMMSDTSTDRRPSSGERQGPLDVRHNSSRDLPRLSSCHIHGPTRER